MLLKLQLQVYVYVLGTGTPKTDKDNRHNKFKPNLYPVTSSLTYYVSSLLWLMVIHGDGSLWWFWYKTCSSCINKNVY